MIPTGIKTNLVLVIGLENLCIATEIYPFCHFLIMHVLVCSGSEDPLEGNIILLCS